MPTRNVLVLLVMLVFIAECEVPQVGRPVADSAAGVIGSGRRVESDGSEVRWRVQGQPGKAAEFDIEIRNNADTPWQGRYCLQSIVFAVPIVTTSLERKTFLLEPGESLADTLALGQLENSDTTMRLLALVVDRPDGAMADFIRIEADSPANTHIARVGLAVSASLEACLRTEQR